MSQPHFSGAHWIWSAAPGAPNFAVRRFRAAFVLPDRPKSSLRVSADSRYVLYIDGVRIGRGPARSDLRHYVYETYDLDIAPGRHVLAALVLSYNRDTGPVAEIHDRGGFLAEIVTIDDILVLATGDGHGWKVQEDTAWSAQPIDTHDGYYGIGAAEAVDGAMLPLGWEQPDYDDGAWDEPVAIRQAYLRERSNDWADPGGRWRLVPRDIPMPRDEPRRFEGEPEWPVTVPEHSRRDIILSAGEYACGYPALRIEGGRGSLVTIRYAEALTKDGVKGVRDDPAGTDVAGFFDTYRSGGRAETYIPLHWRAFRFIKMTVETNDKPLTIRDFHYRMTGYPWVRTAEFSVDDGPDQLGTIQDVDFRTLERCSAETFMDCPYYEQMQYVGDTRLQALLSYVTTGDAQLGVRAVHLFDWSRIPDGLTQSRYPSNLEQIIPPFSLIWVLMVEDLWRYVPDQEQAVEKLLPGCRAVLEWFARHLNPEGVLSGHLPWWNFVDWSWDTGVPPPAAAGEPSATINLQYLAALQAYIRMHEGLGDTRESEFWQAEADMLSDSIANTFWDPDKCLMREGPDAQWGYTQHAQAWGVLTDVIPARCYDRVAESLERDRTLTKTTIYHTFYVAEALAKMGRLERLWDHWLGLWRDALALHLTTWPEQPEPTRSDCHAWSAWPTYALLTHVLGVKPTEPGFSAYEVTPKRVAGWKKIAGRYPLPDGRFLHVHVDWTSGQCETKVTEMG